MYEKSNDEASEVKIGGIMFTLYYNLIELPLKRKSIGPSNDPNRQWCIGRAVFFVSYDLVTIILLVGYIAIMR